MISRNEALRLVQAELADWVVESSGSRFVVVPHMTEETPYAWVVYYDTTLNLETGEWRDMLVGGGPYIVSRQTGSLRNYGSAYSTGLALELHEEREQLYGLRIVADLTSMATKLLVKKLLPLSNQELLQVVREPATWVARGSRLRLKKLRLQLAQQGLATEVQPCF